MAEKSLYAILEINPEATQDEIKDAYRRQAMKWHPDRNPNNKKLAEERFKQLAFAFRVLSDPQQRAKYDIWLKSVSQDRRNFDRENEASQDQDDAQTLFFEQMLDLAFDMAAKGFNKQAILRVLTEMNCPEAVAKAVAANAVKVSRRSQGTTTTSQTLSHSPFVWMWMAILMAVLIASISGHETSDTAQPNELVTATNVAETTQPETKKLTDLGATPAKVPDQVIPATSALEAQQQQQMATRAEAAASEDPEWAQLSNEQKRALKPLASEWTALLPWQREKLLDLALAYPKMNPQQQERVQRRLTNWSRMTPYERENAREKYQQFKALPPEKQEALRRKWSESEAGINEAGLNENK